MSEEEKKEPATHGYIARMYSKVKKEFFIALAVRTVLMAWGAVWAFGKIVDDKVAAILAVPEQHRTLSIKVDSGFKAHDQFHIDHTIFTSNFRYDTLRQGHKTQ